MLGVYKKEMCSLTSQSYHYGGGNRFYLFNLDQRTSVDTHHLIHEADGKTMTVQCCSVRTKRAPVSHLVHSVLLVMANGYMNALEK